MIAKRIFAGIGTVAIACLAIYVWKQGVRTPWFHAVFVIGILVGAWYTATGYIPEWLYRIAKYGFGVRRSDDPRNMSCSSGIVVLLVVALLVLYALYHYDLL